jgi:hypothetical protein
MEICNPVIEHYAIVHVAMREPVMDELEFVSLSFFSVGNCGLQLWNNG